MDGGAGGIGAVSFQPSAGKDSEVTVYDRILKRMREKVRTRQYVMTLHAEEEIDNDGLTVFDVERGILILWPTTV